MIDLLNIVPANIDIADIAVSLSYLCRYNGHLPLFYSVAQHSLFCVELAREQPPHIQLALLLHDASEAYFGDIVSPLKNSKLFLQIRVLDEKLQKLIYKKYLPKKLTFNDLQVVDNVDKLAFELEKSWLWDRRGEGERLVPELTFAQVQSAFLDKFNQLVEAV